MFDLTPRDLTDSDRRVWEEDLADFVPDRVFDAHCHLFQQSHMKTGTTSPRQDIDLALMREWNQAIYPGRRMGFLVLGSPNVNIDTARHNAFIADELSRDPGSRAIRLTTPACTPDQIEKDVTERGFIGLKPYRIYSVTGDRDRCRIHEFLTHEQLEVANHLGLWVTMHLSRPHGCADAHNLDDLGSYTTQRYPRIRWILAHCARSFTYWPIRQAVDRLRDIPNIWYDLSAVNDLRPFLTLFTKENLKRIFYGSDGIGATFFHGKYAVFGRLWCTVEPDGKTLDFTHTTERPILSIYEPVLAMKHAAEIAGLSEDDIEGIFWRNAHEALGL